MRDWCFTLNNYTPEEVAALKTLAEDGKVKYIVWGYEVAPTTGTPHLQGYMEFPRDRQRSTIVRMPGCARLANVQERHGTQEQAINYCKKDGNWEEHGTRKSQGARNDVKELVAKIKAGELTVDEIALEDPVLYNQYGRTLREIEDIVRRKLRRPAVMPNCFWYYGETECGKSHAAIAEAGPDRYDYNPDDHGWWDAYRGEKNVVINELRGGIPYATLLRLCDKWPTTVPRRGREPTPFMAENIWVTSSMHPSRVYPNLDEQDSLEQLRRRFKIVFFQKDQDGGYHRSDE